MDVPRPAPQTRFRSALIAGLGIAVVGSTALSTRLRAAPPRVDASTLSFGTVLRGTVVREILGHGVLVPEHLQWVVAVTPARVRRVLVAVGATVRADDVLVELDNADLELAALEADRQLASAEADLASLGVALASQRLENEASVATLAGEVAQAQRRHEASEVLSSGGLLSGLDRDDARDRSASLGHRAAVEERRGAMLREGERQVRSVGRSQVERLRAIATFRHEQVHALRVVAEAEGTLQEMPVEPGQWVAPGTLIAKVARPGRLKAQIRVPETLAKELSPGLAVRVDTHTSVASGRIAHVDPAVLGGAIRVDVAFDTAPPEGARPDQSVDGIIELDRAENVLCMPRPPLAQAGRKVTLFKLDPRTWEAIRTQVELGRASIDAVEIKAGLEEGDRVILSDMATFDAVNRVRVH